MPGPSTNASFIPKRGATPRRKQSRGGKIYLLTVFSYLMLFAVLAASAGVFFYSGYVKKQLQDEVTAMDAAVAKFKQADMERVKEFDQRLRRAQTRLDNSVAITSIFQALEQATVNTVSLNSLSLTRNGDINYTLQAAIDTNNFDSTKFQRDMFQKNMRIDDIQISSLALESQADEETNTVSKSVSFTALLSVPVEAILYEPSTTVNPFEQEVFIAEPVVESDDVDNQIENI